MPACCSSFRSAHCTGSLLQGGRNEDRSQWSATSWTAYPRSRSLLSWRDGEGGGAHCLRRHQKIPARAPTPCVTREEVGFPRRQSWPVTAWGVVPTPSSERPWPCHVGPLRPSPTSPWWEARPAALPDSIPASWPALHGCHGNPAACQQGLLLLLRLSLGPEPLQGGPGGCQAEGRFPAGPSGSWASAGP